MNVTTNKLYASILALAALGLMLALVWLAVDSRVRSVESEIRVTLLDEVMDVARTINPALVRKLTFTPKDKGMAPFDHIRKQMSAAGKLYRLRAIYGIGMVQDQLVVGPTHFPEAVSQHQEVEGVGESLSAATKLVYTDKRPQVAGPALDNTGPFYFVVAPIVDPITDKVLMAVTIEVEAKLWQTRVHAARQGPILVAMIILVLILLGVVFALRWHQIQKKQDSLNLKGWVMVPTALTALVGLLLFGAYQYQLDREKARQEIQRLTEQAKGEWNRNVDAQVQLLETQLDHLARDPQLLNAWQGRDLPALTSLTQPVYKELKETYKITHFYLIEPERTCFLRVHQPERRGDLIDRETLLAAMHTGEDSWGTELGPMGTFTLRYVRPWRQEGRLVGYLELGMEIEGLIDDLAQSMKLDLVSLIRKEHTTKAKFEAGRQVFGFVGKWESYRDFVVTHQTTQELPAEVITWIEQGHAPYAQGVMVNTKQGERRFLGSFLHLPDVVGRDVADIILLLDVTARANAERTALLLHFGLAVLMSGCILILLWAVTTGAERQLARAFAQVRESEESYRRQFADNSEVMLLLDPKDGHIVDANAAAVVFYGYSRKRLLGMRITDINSRSVSEVKLSMEAVVFGQNRHFEFQHRLADGSLRDVEIASSLIHFGDRMILHTIIHDITAHKNELKKMTEQIVKLEQTVVQLRMGGSATSHEESVDG